MSSRTLIIQEHFKIAGTYGHLFIRESENCRISQIDVDGMIEFDKIVDECECRDSSASGNFSDSFHSIKAGTGVNYLTLYRVTSTSRINLIAQKKLLIEECTASTTSPTMDGKTISANNSAIGPITLYNGTWGCASVEISRCDLKTKDKQPEIGSGVSEQGGYRSIEASIIDDKSALVSKRNSDPTDMTLSDALESLRPGFTLRDSSFQKVGTVERIVEHDSKQIKIVVSGSLPKSLKRIYYKPVQLLVHDGRVVWDESN